MSGLVLPRGTIVTAVLSRSMRGSAFIGSIMLSAGNSLVGPRTVAEDLAARALQWFSGAPVILPPGPPVTLLLQCITPFSHATPTLQAWEIDTELHRRDLVTLVLGDLEEVAGRAVTHFLQQSAAAGYAVAPIDGTPMPNAPGSEQRH